MKSKTCLAFIAVILCAATVFSVSAEIVLPPIPIDDLQDEDESVWAYTLAGGAATVTKYNGKRTSVTVPATLGGNTVTAIGDGAFLNKTRITRVALPSAVVSIGKSAFEGCVKLAAVGIPEGVVSLGDAAFKGCYALGSVSFPSTLRTLGASAFRNCLALKTAQLPYGVCEIGECAFYCCSALESVGIPESVTVVSDYAFTGCSALCDVYYGGSIEQWKEVVIHDTNEPLLGGATVHFAKRTVLRGDVDPDGSVNALDVIALMRYIVGYKDETFDVIAADYNGDGIVNNRDVLQLMIDIVNGAV